MKSDILKENVPPRPAVSVIIKCLNEEARVEQAIRSALEAIANVGGEVILADALSTDRTVELAKKYPVKIVQLRDVSDRSCGAGPQLGYQHSCGKYVYVLDADMILHGDFVDRAVEFLDEHPAIGGVGGLINERNTQSLEYVARVSRNSGHMSAGDVDRLDMGGLYRRNAIEAVGYLSNKNLHSYEELDLAVRLRAGGWRLARIDLISADHFGHDKNPYVLLLNRWKTGYINGSGEILRYAFSRPWWGILTSSLKEAYMYLGFALWNLAGVTAIVIDFASGSPAWHASAGLLLLLGIPYLAFLWKKKNIAGAAYAYASMAISSAGMLRGILLSRKFDSPDISSKVIRAGELVSGRSTDNPMVKGG